MTTLEGLRAYIEQYNLYDTQTKLVTTITVLVEVASTGLIQGTKIEILPYFLPLNNQPTGPLMLVVWRGFLIAGLTATTAITLVSIITSEAFLFNLSVNIIISSSSAASSRFSHGRPSMIPICRS